MIPCCLTRTSVLFKRVVTSVELTSAVRLCWSIALKRTSRTPQCSSPQGFPSRHFTEFINVSCLLKVFPALCVRRTPAALHLLKHQSHSSTDYYTTLQHQLKNLLWWYEDCGWLSCLRSSFGSFSESLWNISSLYFYYLSLLLASHL